MSTLSRRGRTRSKQSSNGSAPVEAPDRSTHQASPSSTRADLPSTTSLDTPGLDDPAPKTTVNGTSRTSEVEASPATANHGTTGPSKIIHEQGGDNADARSSSLSEIEDGRAEEQSDTETRQGDRTAINDSEAETERLESTPQKFRKHKAVVQGSGAAQIFERSPSKLSTDMRAPDPTVGADKTIGRERDGDDSSTNTSKSNGDVEPTTATTSLEDSAGEGSKAPYPLELTPGRKRKRGDLIQNGGVVVKDEGEPATKKTGSVKDGLRGSRARRHSNEAPPESDLEDEGGAASGGEEAALDVEMMDDAPEDPVPDIDEPEPELDLEPDPPRPAPKMKGRKGRRRRVDVGEPGPDIEDSVERERKDVEADEPHDGEAQADGSEETVDLDGEVEGEGEDGEAEAAAKNEEELLKKRSAMDSLGAIEKHFAAFRDRLFDERLNQLSHELALLTQPNQTHPEYQAMLQCLDVRRDEKIELEQTLLSYKLRALEVKSVAERSQIHSQYYQSVRAIREKKLEEAGEQWYQIQRDRRSWDGGVSGSCRLSARGMSKADVGAMILDYTHQFPTRRSQHITQQTSYNLEVSILSGVAKYVGFPAAPPIEGARPLEVEEDFHRMGLRPPVSPQR
ncbi:MAG: hypothetical protein M1838_003180 [Thelocarpon superellum]|nr:MAG: hypothetical protein M1838_003180 [Thelocarpon superellum]